MMKSNDMPEPQTLDYGAFYRITPLFINDLKIVMSNGNVAYVDAKKLFDKIKEHNGIFPNAVLNEFIREIGNFPYRVVYNLMQVIENKDNFQKYFEYIVPEENKNAHGE